MANEPTNFRATLRETNDIAVAWDDASGGTWQHRLLRRLAGTSDPFVEAETLPVATEDGEFVGLVPKTAYQLAVQAFDPGVAESDPVFLTTATTSLVLASNPVAVGGWAAAVSGSQNLDLLREHITPGQGVELYHWHDFYVNAPTAVGNLFDIEADIDWTHEDAVTVRESQCFYSGTGTTFVFRFGAEKAGKWTGVTTSAQPELDGLTFHTAVTPLLNPVRSGYHVFDAANPTWWKQQQGANGDEVRIAPRLTMWDHPRILKDKNAEEIATDVALFADTYGFTGAHVAGPARNWFDLDFEPVAGDWDFSSLSSDATPDVRTFGLLEQLIDLWCSKGGHVHFWLWADAQRDGASTDLPGGANGALSQRLDRYIKARLGPLPGWSAGYGFDCWESIDATLLGDWYDRMSTRIGWFHWVGARFVDTSTAGVEFGNPWANCEDDVVRSGGYPACALPWNEARTAPPQYASWEQHWPRISAHIGGGQTAQDIIDDLEANAASGLAFIDDRPHCTEDRFFLREGGDFDTNRDFADEEELKAVLEAYGNAGWAAIYGRYVSQTALSNLSDPWLDAAGIKAVNDSITEAMENS